MVKVDVAYLNNGYKAIILLYKNICGKINLLLCAEKSELISNLFAINLIRWQWLIVIKEIKFRNKRLVINPLANVVLTIKTIVCN